MNGENVGSSSSKGSISNVNSISVWGEITAVRNNRNVYAVLSAPSGEDRVLQIGIESGSNLTLHGTAQTFYIAITSSDEMLKDNIADTAEQALSPVSYTHLDVYKRQIWNSSITLYRWPSTP